MFIEVYTVIEAVDITRIANSLLLSTFIDFQVVTGTISLT